MTKINFRDRFLILVDRADDGSFSVEPYRCRHIPWKRSTFTTAGDALDHAEAMARKSGEAVFVMRDLDDGHRPVSELLRTP